MIIYVCMYVSMSLFDKVGKDHSFGGMIAYTSERHEKVSSLMRNQLRRVIMKNIQGQYYMFMS